MSKLPFQLEGIGVWAPGISGLGQLQSAAGQPLAPLQKHRVRPQPRSRPTSGAGPRKAYCWPSRSRDRPSA